MNMGPNMTSVVCVTVAVFFVVLGLTEGGSIITTIAPIPCPEGTFDRQANIVEFQLLDTQCIVTVYLSSGQRGPKGPRSNGPKDHKGATFSADIRSMVGATADTCPTLTTQMIGKKTFEVTTNACILTITKDRSEVTITSSPFA